MSDQKEGIRNINANPFLTNYRAGVFQIGTLLMGRNTTSMYGLAKAGYTWVIVDMMFGGNDWSDVAYAVLAAKAAGLATFIRIQSYPWEGRDDDVDRHLVADAARAASLYPDGVIVSVRNIREVESVAEITHDWHRAGFVPTSTQELHDQESAIKEELVLMPMLESLRAVERVDEIAQTEGVKAVYMSSTDLARQLGISYQYDHPNVVGHLEEAVRVGNLHGVPIVTNSGYTYTTVEENVSRLDRLRRIGVSAVMNQTDHFMLFCFAKSVCDGVYQRRS